MSVLVVGSLHLDVVLRAPQLPRLDETVTGSHVDYVFGGKGGNQAVAAARMGADVHFGGRVGRDEFGDMLRATLSGCGVNIDHLQTGQGASGMSAAIVDKNGDYGAVIVSAANLDIDAGAITIPAGTTLVVLQNEVPTQVNLALARKAREQRVPVWLNAAPARALPGTLVACLDLIILNRVEAEFYGDLQDAPPILTTLGPGGVTFGSQTWGAHAVEVISTHGAGDMFVGALAASVGKGNNMSEAIAFAQAAAALHVSCDLAVRANLDAHQVTAFQVAHSSR